MTEGERHFRLINVHRSLRPLVMELRTISKATLPDTPKRVAVVAALSAAEEAFAKVTEAIQGHP